MAQFVGAVLSVCYAVAPRAMCLLLHDTIQKAGSQPKTCASVSLTLCKGSCLITNWLYHEFHFAYYMQVYGFKT